MVEDNNDDHDLGQVSQMMKRAMSPEGKLVHWVLLQLLQGADFALALEGNDEIFTTGHILSKQGIRVFRAKISCQLTHIHQLSLASTDIDVHLT